MTLLHTTVALSPRLRYKKDDELRSLNFALICCSLLPGCLIVLSWAWLPFSPSARGLALTLSVRGECVGGYLAFFVRTAPAVAPAEGVVVTGANWRINLALMTCVWGSGGLLIYLSVLSSLPIL